MLLVIMTTWQFWPKIW